MYLSAGAIRGDLVCNSPSSYTYSTSFLARPAYWDAVSPDRSRENDSTRLNDVLFPSSKVIMWDRELPYLRRELKTDGPDLAESSPMLFVDGHADLHIQSLATPSVHNEFDGVGHQRLHNTANGVRGRDY
jgi:hypothetical protein